MKTMHAETRTELKTGESPSFSHDDCAVAQSLPPTAAALRGGSGGVSSLACDSSPFPEINYANKYNQSKQNEPAKNRPPNQTRGIYYARSGQTRLRIVRASHEQL